MNTAARRLGAAISAVAMGLAITVAVSAPAAADELESLEGQDCVYFIDEDALVCVEVGEDLDAAFTEQTGYTRVESTEDGEPVAARGLLVTYDLARFYVDSGYGGVSLAVTRSTPCNGVTLSSIADLGPLGWNDRISSFMGYGGCTARLYADINYGGSTYGYSGYASTLPGFNDVASSLRVR